MAIIRPPAAASPWSRIDVFTPPEAPHGRTRIAVQTRRHDRPGPVGRRVMRAAAGGWVQCCRLESLARQGRAAGGPRRPLERQPARRLRRRRRLSLHDRGRRRSFDGNEVRSPCRPDHHRHDDRRSRANHPPRRAPRRAGCRLP